METPGQRRNREALPPLPRPMRWAIGLGIAILAGWFSWTLLPGVGFSGDLERVGAGEPVAVLVHESANPTSIGVMERLEALRAAPPGGVEFLVASLGDPEGQQFARRHSAEAPGTLVFFDALGQPRERLHDPGTTEEIVRAAERVAGVSR
ncbi:MAG: hypothetical protein ACQETK_12055 [Pseudomonadota bacterium]